MTATNGAGRTLSYAARDRAAHYAGTIRADRCPVCLVGMAVTHGRADVIPDDDRGPRIPSSAELAKYRRTIGQGRYLDECEWSSWPRAQSWERREGIAYWSPEYDAADHYARWRAAANAARSRAYAALPDSARTECAIAAYAPGS
jgi:hypothetical protein